MSSRGDFESAPLRWDPVRPLTGPGDWLAQVRWVDGTPGRDLRRWLRPADGNDWTVAVPGPPPQRLALVHRLLAALRDGDGEPALHALLQQERARLARRIQSASAGKQLHHALQTLKQPLYPYQREGVERFLAQGRLLLADDMGLGKTAQAIAACHVLWHTGRVRRGLIIVPAALKPQWLREWQTFTDAPAAVVDGTPAERRAAFEACRRGFLLANYEQLIRDLDVVREWTPDIVVLDEAQRIKNWATKTALSVKGLDPPYRLVLTGTPMENRLDELASIVEWVDDIALEPKWRLAAWHTTPVDGKAEIGGARNLDTLRTRLAACMVRRVRQEVLSQLPARTDTRVPVEMTAEQMDEHDALNLPIAQILGRAKRRPLTQAEFLRLMTLLTTQRIIANGLAQLRFEQVWPDLSRIERPTDSTLRGLASPKLLELRELIGQLVLAEGRKVVVFSQWRRMLRLAHWAARDLLAREGVTTGVLHRPGGPEAAHAEPRRFPRRPRVPRALRDRRRRRRPQPAARRERLHQPRAALEPRGARAAHRPDLPARPAPPDRRLQPRQRGRHRVADRRSRRVQEGVLQGTVRRDDRRGGLRAFRKLPLPRRAHRRAGGVTCHGPRRGCQRSRGRRTRARDRGGRGGGGRVAGRARRSRPRGGAHPSNGEIQRLVSGLRVQHTASGGLIIEAPPETACDAGRAVLRDGAASPGRRGTAGDGRRSGGSTMKIERHRPRGQWRARRHGNDGIHGDLGNMVSVSYRI